MVLSSFVENENPLILHIKIPTYLKYSVLVLPQRKEFHSFNSSLPRRTCFVNSNNFQFFLRFSLRVTLL